MCFRVRGGQRSVGVCIMSAGRVLGGTRHNNCTIPTFGVRGLRAVRIIMRATTGLRTPIVVTKAPNAFARTNARGLLTLIDTVTGRCRRPLTVRLSRRAGFSSVTRGIHSNIHSIVVSTSRLPFTRGVSQIGRIISFYRHFSIDIRTRLKRLNNRRSSIRIGRTSTLCAGPTRTHRFTRTAKVSSLTITVNATRKVCTDTPTLSFSELRGVHR